MSLTPWTPDLPPTDINLTVHNYVQNSLLLSRTSQDRLLSQGWSLAQNALSKSAKWRNTFNNLRNPIDELGANVYGFAYAPPSRPPTEFATRLCDLKEWDSVVTQDEIFSLNDLDEFVNTDFSSIFVNIERKSDPQLSPTSAAEKRERSADSVLELQQSKRRKLETGVLYGFIPKPHVYPSPFRPSPSPPKGKPFDKTEPVFIVPNLTFSLPDDARVSWLIPIRGTLPWENCTSAAFLDSSFTIPIPSSPIVNDQISWTQGSILKFWDFLLRLRQVGKLGPLGISFNCSLQSRISPVTTNFTTDTMLNPQESHSNVNFSTVDYIKVNHDAPCRLYVRNVLDAWSYEVKDTDGCVKKIRLLKGARLVLVDARSRGIQIS